MDLVSMQIAAGDAMLRRCYILGTANFDECGTPFIVVTRESGNGWTTWRRYLERKE